MESLSERSLQKGLFGLKKDSVLTDIVLTVGDRELCAHKCVLSVHSSYFRSLFTSDFADSKSEILDFSNHVNSFRILDAVVDYLYGETISFSVDNFAEVASLASYLGCEELVKSCISFLNQTLKTGNCLKYYFSCLACSPMLSGIPRECSEYVRKFLESRFHDSVIFQKEATELTLEQLTHLASKNVTRWCLVKSVLNFLCEWLDRHPAAEDLSGALYFLDTAMTNWSPHQLDVMKEVEIFNEKVMRRMKDLSDGGDKDHEIVRKFKVFPQLSPDPLPTNSDTCETVKVLMVLAPTQSIVEKYKLNPVQKTTFWTHAAKDTAIYSVYAYYPKVQRWLFLSHLYRKDFKGLTRDSFEGLLNSNPDELMVVKSDLPNQFVVDLAEEIVSEYLLCESLCSLNLDKTGITAERALVLSEYDEDYRYQISAFSYKGLLHLFTCSVPIVQEKIEQINIHCEQEIRTPQGKWHRGKLSQHHIVKSFPNVGDFLILDSTVSEKAGVLLAVIADGGCLEAVICGEVHGKKPVRDVKRLAVPFAKGVVEIEDALIFEQESGFAIFFQGHWPISQQDADSISPDCGQETDSEHLFLHDPIYKFSFATRELTYVGNKGSSRDHCRYCADVNVDESSADLQLHASDNTSCWNICVNENGYSTLEEVTLAEDGKNLIKNYHAPPPLPCIGVRAQVVTVSKEILQQYKVLEKNPYC